MKNSRNLMLTLAIGIVFVAMLVIVIIVRLPQIPNFPQPNLIASVPALVSSFRILWSSDGRKLAIGQRDGSVLIWTASDNSTSQPTLTTLNGNIGSTTIVAWNKNGSILATGHDNGVIEIWDTTTSQLVRILEGHTRSIGMLSVSPSGDKVAANGNNLDTIMLDINTGQQLFTLKKHLVKPVWSLSGDLIIGPGASWDAETGQLMTEFEGNTLVQPVLSPDGTLLAIYFSIFYLASGPPITTCRNCDGIVNTLAWSPDSSKLALGSGDYLCVEGIECVHDYGIRVWAWNATEVSQQTPLLLEGHQRDVIALAWHPDGNKLVSASWDDTARIWDVVAGTLLKTFYVGKTRDVSKIAISPDGNMMAVIDDDLNKVHIWDLSVIQ
jgi:WD40 repeat protein